MMRRTVRLATGLASLAVLTVILAGVPYALVRFVGWPLPTVWPSLDQLQHVDQVGISETTIIKTLAVIVWTAWGQLAVAIVAEAAAMARRTTARALPLLPGLQPLAARLIAGIALLASLSTGPRPALAIPLDTAVATIPSAELIDVRPASPDGRTSTTHADRSETATTTIVTGPRDSWWTLAEQHLDDGLRWREIRDLNLDRTVGDGTVISEQTDQLEAGWQLLIPTNSTSPTSSDQAQELRTVADGDHFWSIAQDELTEVWGRQPTDEETTSYWRTLIDANRDRLLPPHDPDLIYPEQNLVIPQAPGRTTPEGQPSVVEPDRQPSGEQASRSNPPTSDVQQTRPAAPADGWRSAIERAEREPANVDQRPAVDVDDEPRTAFGIPADLAAGTAAAALVAAGVVATLRWRRRRALSQRMPGLQLPSLLTETENELTRLDTAAVPEPVLEDLAHLLASIPPDVQPVLVTTDDDGTVTLLFDDTDEVPEPSEPWRIVDRADDGPAGWQARIGDRGPDRSIGLPLLVTLGRTGSTTVHANLSAIRQLTVTGHDDTVRRMLRTITLEVATNRVSIPSLCFVAGDDLLASLDDVFRLDDPRQEVDTARREIEDRIVDDDRAYRLIVCHEGVSAPLVGDYPANNVGVVATTASANPDWILHVDEHNQGRVELPDGGTVELALPDISPELLDLELADLDCGATTVPPHDDEPTAHTTIHEPPESSEDADQAATPVTISERSITEQAWCEVQILGNVEVIRDGQPVEGLTPKTLELLTYLATHRDGTTNELVEDAVWSGRAAPRGTQRIRSALTRLRNVLGDGPEGQPLVPRRTDGSQTLRLSDHVGCDLDRALSHLALAADLPAHLAIEHQTAALQLVRDEPFRNMPVSWATDITQRAIVQLQDAARDIAITCRETGDYDTAQRAIEHALKLHDPTDFLYLELAELEKARGRPDRVKAIWDQLRQRHADGADEIAFQISRPAPEIELAFRELLVGAE